MGALRSLALLAMAIACLGGGLALDLPVSAAAGESAAQAAPGAKAEYDRLMDAARAARKDGDLDTAIARYTEAVALAQKELGPESDTTAETLSFLAHAYYDARNFSKAEPLYRQVLALKRKNFGKDSVQTTVALNALGSILAENGSYEEAEGMLRQALAIRERAEGPDSANTARSAGALAVLLNQTGKYAESEKLFARSIAVLEKTIGPDSPELAGYLNNFGLVLAAEDRLDEAERLYRRALAINEKSNGPDDPSIGAELNNIADLEERRGRYAQAETLRRRMLAVMEKSYGPDDPETASAVANLGYLLFEKGDVEGAEVMDRRALAVRTKVLGPNHPDTVRSFSNLAYVLWQSGDADTAETMYRRVVDAELAIFGSEHPQVAQDMANLAGIEEQKGDVADAERLLRQSTAIFEKAYGPNHPDVAQSLGNLGQLLAQQKRLDEAEQLFRRELSIVKETYGPQSLQAARTYGHLAGVLVDRGKAGEASALNRDALAIMDKVLGPEHETTLGAVNNLAYSLRREGKDEEALAYFRRAAAAGTPFVWAHLDSLWRAAGSGGEKPGNALVEGFAVVQAAFASKAGAALNQLGARLAAGTSPLATLVRQEQDLVSRERDLDRTLLAEASKPEPRPDVEAGLTADLEKVRDDLDKTREALKSGFPQYTELEKPSTVGIDEAQRLLAPNEALIVLDTESGFVWAVTRETALWNRIAAKPAEIEQEIAGLRGEIAGGMRGAQAIRKQDKTGGAGRASQLAYALYRALLAPVEGALAGKDKLIFVLDGRTSSLPPAVLVAGDPKGKKLRDVDWLIKSHAVTVLPSVSSLKTLRAQSVQEAPKPFRGYGDPVLGSGSTDVALAAASRGYEVFFRGGTTDLKSLSSSLAPLPETADEVRTVAKSLGAADADIVLGPAATETDVKTARLDDYRILYFATHGLVAGDVETAAETSAEPALVLSLPASATSMDDGLLTASEIAGLKLNADWVVLSACNTAAGDKPGAEALSGLARAFFYAGARSLLVSHWPVESQSAVSLMTRVFSNVEAGANSADALREAMLAVMNDPDHPEWAQPAYWAPFILVGDPGAVRR